MEVFRGKRRFPWWGAMVFLSVLGSATPGLANPAVDDWAKFCLATDADAGQALALATAAGWSGVEGGLPAATGYEALQSLKDWRDPSVHHMLAVGLRSDALPGLPDMKMGTCIVTVTGAIADLVPDLSRVIGLPPYKNAIVSGGEAQWFFVIDNGKRVPLDDEHIDVARKAFAEGRVFRVIASLTDGDAAIVFEVPKKVR